MNHSPDLKRGTGYGAQGGRETQANCSSASRKWPHEASKIAEALELRKTQIQERMSRVSDSSSRGKRAWIVVCVIVVCVIAAVWGLRAAKDLIVDSPERDPRLKAIQEGSREVENLAKAVSSPEVETETKQVAVPPAPAGVPELGRKADTVWLPAPVVPDSVARKTLRSRIVADPAHKGVPITYISKDSVWLLMRIEKDSVTAYRSIRPYIDHSGNLIMR